ncbi:MAG: class I SAM-dependent methyltransferase [Candidatus Micrarchaeota archaeon]
MLGIYAQNPLRFHRRGTDIKRAHKSYTSIIGDAMFTKDYVKMQKEQISDFMKYVPAGERALDLGAGKGFFNRIFRKKFKKIYALDLGLPSKVRKVRDRKRMKHTIEWESWFSKNDADVKIEFDLDSEAEYPFKADYFDFVFSGNVIEHLKNPKNFEKQILRVLRPGGMAMIITPKRKCLVGVFDKYIYRGHYNGWDTDHKHLYQPDELAAEMEDAGFETMKKLSCGILFYYVPYISALGPLNMGLCVISKKPARKKSKN